MFESAREAFSQCGLRPRGSPVDVLAVFKVGEKVGQLAVTKIFDFVATGKDKAGRELGNWTARTVLGHTIYPETGYVIREPPENRVPRTAPITGMLVITADSFAIEPDSASKITLPFRGLTGASVGTVRHSSLNHAFELKPWDFWSFRYREDMQVAYIGTGISGDDPPAIAFGVYGEYGTPLYAALDSFCKELRDTQRKLADQA